jgi:hypothetical protein
MGSAFPVGCFGASWGFLTQQGFPMQRQTGTVLGRLAEKQTMKASPPRSSKKPASRKVAPKKKAATKSTGRKTAPKKKAATKAIASKATPKKKTAKKVTGRKAVPKKRAMAKSAAKQVSRGKKAMVKTPAMKALRSAQGKKAAPRKKTAATTAKKVAQRPGRPQKRTVTKKQPVQKPEPKRTPITGSGADKLQRGMPVQDEYSATGNSESGARALPEAGYDPTPDTNLPLPGHTSFHGSQTARVAADKGKRIRRRHQVKH